MDDSPAPRVSVVILSYRSGSMLPEAIASLRLQTIASDMEIIVADNDSRDGSAEVARKLGVRVVEVGSNAGYARGNNAGAAIARGKWLFIGSADMRFAPDCLERLVEKLEADPTLFAADPLQYNWEGTRVVHGATRLIRGGPLHWFPGRKVDFVAQWEHEEIVPWGCAGCLMVDAEKWRALGGFDPTFFIECEDLDLCWRAWLRGWGTLFVPSARLWHRVGGSTDKPDVKAERPPAWRHRSFEKNFQRFAVKAFPSGALPGVLVAKLLQAVGFLVRGRWPESGNVLRAIAATTRALPTIWRERRALDATSATSRRALYDRLRHPPLRK